LCQIKASTLLSNDIIPVMLGERVILYPHAVDIFGQDQNKIMYQ